MRLSVLSICAALACAHAHAEVKTDEVAKGLEFPWALEFLPDGSMLVTEKPGRMRIVSADGKLGEPLAGLPEVEAVGQGGLLDVALAPDFDRSKRIYFAYTQPVEAGGNRTAVATATLDQEGAALNDVKVIFEQNHAREGRHHYGSRVLFDATGEHLYITLGDRYAEMKKAQTLDTHFGKVVRIKPDGSIPADNPFVSTEGALPEIWSYGHRNIQGAAIHPQTGELWTHEHGPRGGDELQPTLAGRNHGWPVISYGIDYSGAPIAEGTERDGMEQPTKYWDPSIAPSGLEFYTGDAFPDYKGSALVGSLKFTALYRVMIDDRGIYAGEEVLIADLGERIRDVKQGPDGLIYVLTDSPKGRVLRLSPGG